MSQPEFLQVMSVLWMILSNTTRGWFSGFTAFMAFLYGAGVILSEVARHV